MTLFFNIVASALIFLQIIFWGFITATADKSDNEDEKTLQMVAASLLITFAMCALAIWMN